MTGLRISAVSLCALLFCTGCNLTALVVKSTADGTAEFTKKHGLEFPDPEMVGPVLATATVTNEGFLYYAPDYEPLLVSAIFANIAYGVGWLGSEAHAAEVAGDFDTAEHLGDRAGLLFVRAMALSKRMLRLRDDGFDDAMGSGVGPFRDWVDENFYEKQDAEALLVAGIAYLVGMLNSEEGLAAAVDAPYALYMIERSIELDETVQGGQGLMVLGIYQCTVPAMVGGNPKLGLQMMMRAAGLTDRKSHGVLVQIAERCAVALQDRKLFYDTLMEIIESGDVPEYRLPNKLARHHAERLLKQQDELFYQ
jgi:hypothetical protein